MKKPHIENPNLATPDQKEDQPEPKSDLTWVYINLVKQKSLHLCHHEILQGLAVLLGLLLLFFSTPLLNSGDSYYSAVDLTQIFSLTNIEPGHLPANPLLSDQIVQINPWLMFNRDSIWAGKLPVWNPYNANGVPHLANFQSAVFSLFSLPFYMLSFRQALLVSAFMRLFGLGFFTFLFLKQLNLKQFPALIGSVSFMFCGYNLQGPYANALVMLPAGMYFSERVFFKPSQGSVQCFWPLTGLCLSLVGGLLAGHPETFFFCFLLLGAYILFRLFIHLREQHYSRVGFRQIFNLTTYFSLAGLLALGIAAIQLLPFFEYYTQSFVTTPAGLAERKLLGAGQPLHPELIPLWFLPNLLGNSRLSYNAIDRNYLPFFTNFIDSNLSYIGGTIIFLSFVSLWFIRRNRYIAFFASCAILWLFCVYNFFGIGGLFRLLPITSDSLFSRTTPIWLFSVSCCAALSVNQLTISRANPRRPLALSVFLCGSASLIIILIAAKALLENYVQYLQPQASEFLKYVPEHLWWFGLSFGLSLLAVIVFWLTSYKQQLLRAGLGGLLLAVIVWQGAGILKDYIPTVKDSFFYPVTPAIKRLQEVVADKNLLVLGDAAIPPDSNLVYKLNILPSYENIWVRSYMQLYQKLFEGVTLWHIPTKYSEVGLKLFGIDYLLARNSWVKPGSLLEKFQRTSTKTYPVGEITPGKDIVQEFYADKPGLQEVTLLLATYARLNRCNLQFKLEEVLTSKVITIQSLPCQKIGDNKYVNFTFPALKDSQGKQYRVVLSSPDAIAGNAVTAWAFSDLDYKEGVLGQGNQFLPGSLVFNLGYNTDSLVYVADLEGYVLYHYQGSLSKYYTVDHAQLAASEEEALKLVLAPEFNPARSVILTVQGLKAPTYLTSPIQDSDIKVLEDRAELTRLKVIRTQPGYLVLNKTYYPGWKVRVNNLEKPVLQANYAFSAVELGAGESIIEFYYESDSVKLGGIVTLISLTFGLGSVLYQLVFRRWRRLKRGRAVELN